MSPCKFYMRNSVIKMLMEVRIRLSYNDVHKAIQSSAVKIKEEFGASLPSSSAAQWCWADSGLGPDLFIAIGGGGFIPARILRTFCKTNTEGVKKNIPIQAVGLVLYESMGGVSLTSYVSHHISISQACLAACLACLAAFRYNEISELNNG